MKNNMMSVNIVIDNIQSRREQWEGDEYVVFPVVALVEGVHHNNRGACYYPAEELSKHYGAWNGIPVPVFHPEVNGDLVSANDPDVISQWNIGRTFNFRYENGKLKGEVWINVKKAQQISPDILEILNSDEKLQVSTGHFSDDEEVQGSWQGEAYDVILRNLVPDHLALLPSGTAACSWADGCGIRANKKGGKADMDELEKVTKELLLENDRKKARPLLQKLKVLIKHKLAPTVDEVSFEDTRRALQKVVDEMDNGVWMHYVMKVYEDRFIYQAEPHPDNNRGLSTKMWSQDYSIDDNGIIDLGDTEPVEVMEKPAEYVPINNKFTEGKKMTTQECCAEMIQLLIENEVTNWKEDDREYLTGLSEDIIKKMVPVEKKETAVQTAVKKAAKESGTGIPIAGNEGKRAETADEWLAANKDIPDEIKQAYVESIRANRAKKQELIKFITDSEVNPYTADDLKDMEIAELEKVQTLCKAAEPKVDYAANAGFSAPTGVEIDGLDLPKMDLSSSK